MDQHPLNYTLCSDLQLQIHKADKLMGPKKAIIEAKKIPPVWDHVIPSFVWSFAGWGGPSIQTLQARAIKEPASAE